MSNLAVKRGKSKQTPSQLLLAKHLKELGFGNITHEFKFCPDRKFRADLAAVLNPASPNHKMTLFECDGGQWAGGHMRGRRLDDQYEKDRLAQVLGYKIFRFTNQQVLSGAAKAFIEKWLK